MRSCSVSRGSSSHAMKIHDKVTKASRHASRWWEAGCYFLIFGCIIAFFIFQRNSIMRPAIYRLRDSRLWIVILQDSPSKWSKRSMPIQIWRAQGFIDSLMESSWGMSIELSIFLCKSTPLSRRMFIWLLSNDVASVVVNRSLQ
jgi:hypothetical protein